MTETAKEVAVPYPAVRAYDRDKSIIALTGAKRGANVRYEIIWEIPSTDEEAQKRYGVSLSDLVGLGIQILSHRPDYKAILVDDVYSEEYHIACQKLADSYKPGIRTVGKSAELKASAAVGRKATEAATALGFTSIEEALAFAQKAKTKTKANAKAKK